MSVILADIKKMLGPDVSDTAFDTDILIHINSAITKLNLLGVGPSTGFVATANTTWVEYIPSIILESTKTYIYLKCRLVFDPPQNSFLVTAIEKQIKEYGWDLSILAEEV